MYWQSLGEITAAAYDTIANKVYALVGDSTWRKILAVVVVLAAYVFLSCVFEYVAYDLARSGVIVIVRVLYWAFIVFILDPAIVFVPMAMLNINGGYYAAIPAFTTALALRYYMHCLNWRDWHNQDRKDD